MYTKNYTCVIYSMKLEVLHPEEIIGEIEFLAKKRLSQHF